MVLKSDNLAESHLMLQAHVCMSRCRVLSGTKGALATDLVKIMPAHAVKEVVHVDRVLVQASCSGLGHFNFYVEWIPHRYIKLTMTFMTNLPV